MVARGRKPPKVVKKKAAARRVPSHARRGPIITADVTKAVVDQVPPMGYDINSRSMRYARVTKDIREKVGPGKVVVVATFLGRGGATQVRNAILRGERRIDGELGDWVFDARRDLDGGSTLYATLVADK